MDGIPNEFSIFGNADGVLLLDCCPKIDVLCGFEALPNKLGVLAVVVGVLVMLPNVGVWPYGGGAAEFAWPNVGVGDENAPKPADCVVVAVGVPNCGFVSVAGLLGVNENVPGVVAGAFVFVVFIPNNGIALAVVVVAAAAPNVINGVLVDVVFPNWKALVSGKINKNSFL